MNQLDDLRRVRHEAHNLFDAFWKAKRRGSDRTAMRHGCYAWLRRHTGMSERECHFGQFDVGVCLAVIDLCKQAKAGLIKPPRPRGNPHKSPALNVKSSGRESRNLKRRIANKRF